jgi:uncharacterized protein DUF4129
MSRGRRLALSGAALTALLALVAIASRAHRPGAGSGAEPAHPPTLLADYAATLVLILLPLGAVFLIWALAQSRRQALLARRTSWRHTLLSLLIMGVILVVVVFLTARHGSRSSDSPSAPAPAVPRVAPAPQKARPFYRAHFRWLPALVLGSLVLGLGVTAGAALALRRREGEAWDEQAALAVALDEVLADTLDDLRAERDPRRAVIRTYARMEQTFAAYGVPRKEAETPLEYLARVLETLGVGTFSMRRVTQLFARAKFSPHEVDAAMKDEAIEALVGLRAELEHGRQAA